MDISDKRNFLKNLRYKVALCYENFLKSDKEDASFPSAERPIQLLAFLKEEHFWPALCFSLVVSSPLVCF